MSNLVNLTDRVAIITGSSRGIGLSIAEKFASHGANLILSAHTNADDLDKIAQRLSDSYNVKIHTEIGDISDPATSASLVKTAFSQHKQLDIFVNNAGVLRDGLIGMVKPDDIDSTIAINLTGVIHSTQAAARLMSRSGGGSIINMTSIIGRVGNRGQLVYGASKAGVIGATLSAAKELAGKNIRVNAIAPGFIDTDMVRQIPAAMYKERMASIAMGRIGKTDDIANAALFLASDLSSYVTGQIIGVDGGMLI